MPNTDRILEAEDSIKNIAVELKRMRDAATILEASQEKTDVFLRSAERLMQVTENFYSQCRTIVEKLSEADLDQRLNGIQTGLDTVTADVQKHATAADEAQSDLVTSHGYFRQPSHKDPVSTSQYARSNDSAWS